MVYLLVFSCVLDVLVLSDSCPHDVPLLSQRGHNSDARYFERVDQRVVNMGRLCDFETQRHVKRREVLLIRGFHFLERLQVATLMPLCDLHESLALLHAF